MENINRELLDNPYVEVIWEDKLENMTNENIKKVKSYFNEKYNSSSTNVITKPTREDEIDSGNSDIRSNLLDNDHQKTLIEAYIKRNDLSEQKEKLMSMNDVVDRTLSVEFPELSPFKTWRIKNIKLSNFLSFGDSQTVEYDKLHGITIIESDPPNYGGKTTLGVDLLLFLFFNRTLKTSTSEEIFNEYTDKNEVLVSGTITIDGEDYVIERIIERKVGRSGNNTIKNKLNFFKLLPGGEVLDLNGEQRRETENFIRTSIGNESDFLMTILTTSGNMDDLLMLKPTGRGEILNRFLGLDIIKKKEEIAKRMRTEFSRKMLSNIHDADTLRSEIKDSTLTIAAMEKNVEENLKKISEIEESIGKGEKFHEELIASKHYVDEELLVFDLERESRNLHELEKEKDDISKKLNEILIPEHEEKYDEVAHDSVRERKLQEEKKLAVEESKLNEIKALMVKYKGGVECENCGIKLIESKHVKSKIDDKTATETKISSIRNIISQIEEEDRKFLKSKTEFNEIEKKKLIRDKLTVKEESLILRMEVLEGKIKRFKDQEDNIENNRKLESKIIKAKMRLADLTSMKEKLLIANESNENSIKHRIALIKSNEEMLLKMEEESRKEKVFEIYEMIIGKKGISKTIMRSMIPIINDELRELMEDSALFSALIKVNDKNEVEFWMKDNSTGIEKRLLTGSGYEKTIASLALRAVLTRISPLPKPNIVVFDEVFGGVAMENMDLVGDFFTKLKKYFDIIFIITHNNMANNWADNVIKISKTNNVSTIIN